MESLANGGAVGQPRQQSRSSGQAFSIKHFAPPVRRSLLRSWLAGLWHVKNGAVLGDFLVYVYHFLARMMPQGRQVVPLNVLDEGRVVCVAKRLEPHPLEKYLEPSDDALQPLRGLNPEEAGIVETRIKVADSDLHRTDAPFAAACEKRDAAADRVREAVEDGTVAVPMTLKRAAHKRGRPRWHPWKLLALYAAIGLLLLTEAYQFSLPYMNESLGIDMMNLNAEWTRNPVGILLGAAFALGASAILCLLVSLAVRLSLSVYAGDGSIAQRAAKAMLAALLGILVVFTTHGIACMRHGLSGASQDFAAAAHGGETTQRSESGAVFFLLTLLLPVGVAYLGHLAQEERTRGNRIRAEQRAWDLQENQLRERRERVDEVLRVAEENVARIDSERNRIRQILDTLERRIIGAREELRHIVESERAYALAFAHAAVACHRRAAFYFVRAALRRKRPDLLGRSAVAWGAPRVAAEHLGGPDPAGGNGRLQNNGEVPSGENWRRAGDAKLSDGDASPGKTAGMIITSIALVLAVIATPSGAQANTPSGPTQVDTEAICSVAANSDKLDCSLNDLVGTFDGWAKEALLLPGSTFVVWAVGHDRSAVSPVFVTCIPETWGAGVLEAKSSFLHKGRDLVGALTPSNPIRFPDGCGQPRPNPGRAHEVRLLSPSLRRVADLFRVEANSNDHPLHVAVVCDRSNSGLGRTCTQANVLAVFDRWLLESKGVAGSSFTVYAVGRSFDTARAEFKVSVDPLPPIAKIGALIGARNEVHVEGSNDDNSSAVAEAVAVAGTELHEKNGRRELIILSDLREFLAGIWNFERSVPSPATFFDWLKKSGLLVDMRDTKVLACGVHNGRSPAAGPFAPQLAAAVRETWEVALRSMGADDLRILSQCDDAFAISRDGANG